MCQSSLVILLRFPRDIETCLQNETGPYGVTEVQTAWRKKVSPWEVAFVRAERLLAKSKVRIHPRPWTFICIRSASHEFVFSLIMNCAQTPFQMLGAFLQAQILVERGERKDPGPELFLESHVTAVLISTAILKAKWLRYLPDQRSFPADH